MDGSGACSASVISACVVLPARAGIASWPCKPICTSRHREIADCAGLHLMLYRLAVTVLLAGEY